ncbi:hypothetical protein HNQ93_002541 [Hymenobacter luteus]|uniref:Uncharacterized protein n=2 Tax=Hymenobacter TaxID=89966 RepID=A0A7W9T1F8_9BACT|nr:MULTISPECIES: hypothetical protein [Hymenobacter]MBB4601890.1 hypothetical protein [Hymenobacter latericoloratus]MBB6059681.1 hypothetical protein [Hymenobacter luteus]
MDTAATLAFFQNFYTDAALYVVPEPVASPTEATSPALTAAPAAVAAAAAATTRVLDQLPSSGNLPQPGGAAAGSKPTPLVPPVTLPPVPVAAVVSPAPLATPVATPPPAPEAPRQATTLTLAQLPAAAAAPAGRVQPTPTQSPVAHIPFSTLGSNANGLLILVRLPAEEFRKLPRNVFLNNLLKAIRLIVEDVVLVNVEHPTYPVALCSLRQHLAARQFLAFGKNLLDVAVYTTQPYEPVLLFGDTAFLSASEISMLEYDAGRKKQLWQAVQRMFMA